MADIRPAQISAQIAKGESDLADGKDSLDGLTKLIKGINKLLKGYKNKRGSSSAFRPYKRIRPYKAWAPCFSGYNICHTHTCS